MNQFLWVFYIKKKWFYGLIKKFQRNEKKINSVGLFGSTTESLKTQKFFASELKFVA